METSHLGEFLVPNPWMTLRMDQPSVIYRSRRQRHAGVGLGSSIQSVLPPRVPYGFYFPIIGEEFGFMGVIVIAFSSFFRERH
jgi:hypothetical protein